MSGKTPRPCSPFSSAASRRSTSRAQRARHPAWAQLQTNTTLRSRNRNAPSPGLGTVISTSRGKGVELDELAKMDRCALAAIDCQCHSYRMLVFIDESGDPGFKVEKGASPVFVLAMVIFDSADYARQTSDLIARSEARRRHKGEFKFNKCRDEIRDLYFEEIVRGRFRVRAIVVKKEVIYSPRLQSDKETFYEYFVKSMMKNDGGVLKDAKIVIDGSGDREFQQNLATALRRRTKIGTIKDMRFRDSAGDSLVQLADMCVGAIARSYRTDRPNPARWRDKLRPRIEDVWNFR